MRFRTLVLFAVLLGVLVSLGTLPAAAQQTQKRSEVELWPVGPPEEISYRPWDPYNLSFALEVGGQIADVSGNHDVFDTQQNYRDGFKVFSFNFRGEEKDTGAFLTDFYVQGGGWANEPYSWTKFGFSKEKWFDFRGQFRESEYRFYFPLGHTFGRNLHRDWTERRFQDYDLTIFPKQKFRVKLGYSRNSTFGPTFTTADFDRDVLLLFEPLRQTYDEYTIGAEWNIQRWLILGEYGYRYFRNDRCMDNPDLRCTFENLDDPVMGDRNQGENLPTSGHGADATAADIFRRSYPARGKVPFARVNLVGRPHRTLEVSAGLRYSSAESEFTYAQNFVGHSRQLSAVPLDVPNVFETIDAFGRSLRPLTTFDGNITWRPVPRLTLTNNFQFRGYTQSGFIDEEITEDVGLPTEDTEEVFVSTIVDLDTFFDRIEGRYDFTNWFGVRAGFSITKRDYRFFEFEIEDGTIHFEQECVDDFGVQAEHCETNKYTNRSFLYGADLRLNRRAQFFFDAEIGNHKSVFTRVSPANIERYRLRSRFEPWDGIKFNYSWFLFDTSNSNLPTRNPAEIDGFVTEPELIPGQHRTQNLGFAVDFQLARWERGYFDVGYSRNDITTLTDVIYRTEGGGGPGGSDFYHRPVAEYILNDNYFYFDVGGRIAGNLYGEAGYRVVFDTGTFPASDPTDPCTVQTYLAFSGGFILPDPAREPGTPEGCGDFVYGFPFDPADSPPSGDGSDRVAEVTGFPDGGGLKYHQPHASVRYGVNDNITWKFGWRYYRYNVNLGTFSDYKAHVVTTSVVLNF
jgi:hypothetical protein